MRRKLKWRFISDYTGAGSYVMEPNRAVVGTKIGLQCVSRDPPRRVLWSLDLGSRCLGVSKAEGGRYLATCRRGLFLVSAEGKIEKRKLFAGYLSHEAVRMGGGMLVTEGPAVQFFCDWEDEPAWTYRLRSSLGKSVKAIRPIDVFEASDSVVAGYVDYDTGVGRVFVLDKVNGKARWVSDPGPVSEVFDAGDGQFVWCLSGYGKFESRRTRLDGSEVWRSDFAGLGARRDGDSVVMVVGSNESPAWDHWQISTIGPDGIAGTPVKVRGRSAVRPTCHPDGSIYVVSYVFHIDPASSRVEYTSFLRMPQELLFQHLIGTELQIPEYEVYLQKLTPGADKTEVLHHISGSFSLARPALYGDDVIFCDGADLIAVSR